MKTLPGLRYGFTLAWTALGLLAIVRSTSATTISACQDQIQLIRDDLATVVIDDRRAGATNDRLASKLDSASSKLDARKGAKCGDALQALWDFIDKVDALANDGKMTRSDADRLMCATSSELLVCPSIAPPGAIQCIVELGPDICADSVTP